ncbi:MAG: helix-turn-helix transcriptional regulator [Saprospiraceae bacterium]|nr:helix-turn-helix transcriptional regulator [Candidatus Defluviibacterium haderslevense]
MKTIGLSELKDKSLGKIGTHKRDKYEHDLKIEILAEHIKQLRIERNLTQEELGALVGVQRAQISKIENNTGNITLSTLLKIFSALNASIKYKIKKQEYELS